MILDNDFIAKYAVKDMPYHAFHTASVEINRALEVHACDDKLPEELLKKARPNEADIYQKWRLERWTPITKPYWDKVLFNSAKVGRAEDWHIGFPDIDSRVPEEESLKKYLTVNYPYWDSFENWFWKVCWPNMFKDPDGVICVLPLPKENYGNDTEYLKPFTYIYKSCQVVDFKEGEYAVIESDEKTIVTNGTKQEACGRVLIFITENQITEARQYGKLQDWTFEYSYPGAGESGIYDHNIGSLPVYQLGGLLKEFKPGYKLYESFISPCIPHWNEAVMDYSDHQVNKAIHLHPDKWSFATSQCPTCTGTGKINGEGKEKLVCKSCQGLGKVQVQTPFGETILKVAEQSGPNSFVGAPTPPKGYINRPMESLQFLKDEYLGDIKEGLGALNMEFVMNIPGDQSGIAKAYDRDPLVSYYEMLGKHIVENIFVPSFYYISKWRYGYSIPDEAKIDELQPKMSIPKRFDIVISSMLSESLKSAHDAGMGASVTSPLETQFARKQFGENSIQAIITEIVSQHDPLTGKTDDEKMVILSNKGCTQEDYILSSKIYAFVRRAMVEVKDFKDLDYKGKNEVFAKYTAETVAGNTKSLVPIVTETGANA